VEENCRFPRLPGNSKRISDIRRYQNKKREENIYENNENLQEKFGGKEHHEGNARRLHL
jgi:hypothetical protein